MGKAHKEPARSFKGPLPVWPAETFPDWRAVYKSVVYEKVPQWVDDFLAADAAAWSQEQVGIVWYEHDAFGRRVHELAGEALPYLGGGKRDDDRLLAERGNRSVLLSIEAHGTGKKLQRFNQNLLCNFPRKVPLEQLIGRTHRQGQYADEVEMAVYRHVPEYVDAWDKAVGGSRYVDETQAAGIGLSQKLLIGSRTWDS